MKGTAYLFQASLIIVWWISISINHEFYELFAYSKVTKVAYFALLVPDFLLLGILSLIRAYFVKRDFSLIILGAFAWHLVVRPIEEKDLLQKFGEDYTEYRNSIMCWIPRQPYSKG